MDMVTCSVHTYPYYFDSVDDALLRLVRVLHVLTNANLQAINKKKKT
jgi:hypothetical protein